MNRLHLYYFAPSIVGKFIVIGLLFTTACTNLSPISSQMGEGFLTDMNTLEKAIQLNIELDRTKASTLKDINATVTILNTSNEVVYVMLDHPKYYTGGLWTDYHFDLLNASDSSVLYSDNNAMLSSITFPMGEEIDEHKLEIEPRHKHSKTFNLRSLIMPKPIGEELPEGTYRLRLRKGEIESNWVEIVIRK